MKPTQHTQPKSSIVFATSCSCKIRFITKLIPALAAFLFAFLPAATALAQSGIINLANTGSLNNTIVMDAATGTTIAGIYVSGTANYTVTGAGIIATPDAGALAGTLAATGKLILGANAAPDASTPNTTTSYAGTLTLDNGANNFENGIEVLTGTLVGNTATLDAGAAGITIGAAGTLVFDQATDATYSSPITGAGVLVKSNTGALTLAADNTAFTGLTNIAAGALILGAPLGGDIHVNATGTLAKTSRTFDNRSGSGSASFIGAALGNVTVASGGAIVAGGNITAVNGAGILPEDHPMPPPSTFGIGGALTLATSATLVYKTPGISLVQAFNLADPARNGGRIIYCTDPTTGAVTTLYQYLLDYITSSTSQPQLLANAFHSCGLMLDDDSYDTAPPIAVAGDLALDGAQLNIVETPGIPLTPGCAYPLITYTGALTGTNLTIGAYTGTTPLNLNNLSLDFSVPGQVNLIYASGTAAASPPNVTKVDPTTTKAGATITITGANLAGVTVTIGGQPATIVSTSNDGATLKVTVPDNATTGTIVITPLAGPPVTATQTLTFLPSEPPALTVNKFTLSLAKNATATDTFAITSNIDWTAQIDSSATNWLAVNPATGNGDYPNATVTTITENTTGAPRSAKVIVSDNAVNGADITRTLVAIQAAATIGLAPAEPLPANAKFTLTTTAPGAQPVTRAYTIATGTTLTTPDATGALPLAYEYNAATATLLLPQLDSVYALKFTTTTAGTLTLYTFDDDGAYESSGAFTYAPPAATCVLTVNSGSGSGNYAPGATVTITANPAPTGQVFDKWTTATSGVTFANATAATTTITMPATSATVTATYKTQPTGGGGGGGNTGGGSGSGNSGGGGGAPSLFYLAAALALLALRRASKRQ